LALAAGVALGNRIKHDKSFAIAVLGDGETNEGSVWEAAMFAAAQKLDNICVIIDYNKWQATGRSNDTLMLAPLTDKWRSFGWDVIEMDGHDVAELARVMSSIPNGSGKPMAIVAHTIKGKGVSFMEDDNNWHYRIPTADEVRQSASLLNIPQDQIQLDGRKPISHG
jgi:transketolase